MKARLPNLWDERQARSSAHHFTPHRRGPEKIKWPLEPKKALIILTGRNTLKKALVAYEAWVRARCAEYHKPPPSSQKIREQALDGPFTKEVFELLAEGYLKFPRRGFNAAAHEKRFSKIFPRLGLKWPLS
jgi:hypothetical protein